ncbi:MAG: N-acetyltransferase, partial [Gemmatimonadales bacterium]|nr:N-acetyltransferase [Gemmatimonadales bacterium]
MGGLRAGQARLRPGAGAHRARSRTLALRRGPALTTALTAPASAWTLAPADGAAALGEAEWNCLARRGFHTHHWFRAAEDSGWRARHVIAREGSRARAVIPAYLTGADTLHDLHDRWLGPLRGLERLGLGLRPVLSVQSPFSLSSDILGDSGALPLPALDEAFGLLEEAAWRARAKAVVWPFVDPADDAVLATARERGYAVVEAGATARLRIRWASFEEYVASRSKSVRRTIRADLAGLGAGGMETLSTSDYRVRAGEMDALYRRAYRRRNGRDARVASGFFERLARQAAPEIWAQLTSSGGRIVGTSLNLAAGSVMDGTFAAFAAPAH